MVDNSAISAYQITALIHMADLLFTSKRYFIFEQSFAYLYEASMYLVPTQ